MSKRKRRRILVITGVPGTGKTTFSDSLAKRLKHTDVIHVTDVVNRERLFSSRTREGAKIVKMRELRLELERMIARSKGDAVLLESHLMCDIAIKGASALVLREHLDTLIKRMEQRGYPRAKIKANVVSEATDYCGIHAERNYPNVFEAFSRDRKLAGYAAALLNGKRLKGRRIDLIPEFDTLLRRRKELAI